MKLHDRVALVTGGAHRLGRAIALALAEAGAHIALHYHSSVEKANATIADIQALGVQAAPIAGDLSSVGEAERIVDAAIAQWDRLDVLVCSAGVWGQTPVGSVDAEWWDNVFAINARAPFFMAQRAAPYLRAARGSLVAVADSGITGSWKGYTPYLASKAALAMMVQNLASDLAPNVRVNAIAPGPVLLPDDWDAEQHAKIARTTLLDRVGRAEDVAKAAVFLASADYITGATLPVDGGQRLK